MSRNQRRMLATMLWVLAGVAAVAAVYQWQHRQCPLGETSDLYRRYEGQPGIAACYIKDFQVNDTLALGVTLLEATDSAGWARLMEDFNDLFFSIDPNDVKNERDYNSLALRVVPRGHPEQTVDTSYKGPLDHVTANLYNHSICIFEIENHSQRRAIIYSRLNAITDHQDNIIDPRNSREVGPSYATPPMPFYKRITNTH